MNAPWGNLFVREGDHWSGTPSLAQCGVRVRDARYLLVFILRAQGEQVEDGARLIMRN